MKAYSAVSGTSEFKSNDFSDKVKTYDAGLP